MKVKITVSYEIDNMIDEETLRECYDNSIEKAFKDINKVEHFLWMVNIETENIISIEIQNSERKTIKQFIEENSDMPIRLKNRLIDSTEGGKYYYRNLKYLDEINTEQKFRRIRNAGGKMWNVFRQFI